MVSVGVSALGKTSLHFVDPGTKINGKYYRDVLLMSGLLPDIRSYSEYFTLQQDGAPAHRAQDCRSAEARDAGLHSAHTMAAQQS